MRIIQPLGLFLIGFLFALESKGGTVTGCRIGNNNFLYTSSQGVKPWPVSQWYVPTFETYSNPGQTEPFLQSWYDSYNNCKHFVGNPVYSAQCAVEGITYISNNSVKNLGNTITYTVVETCPLDEEVIYLLVMTIIASVWFMRKSFPSS